MNKQISRRRFLNSGLLFSGGLAFSNKMPPLKDMENGLVDAKNKKPNILMIICDEFNAQMAGAFGNKIVRTPNIDQLAAGGITFDNCYTNCPICCPSRLALISGKYISRTGVWGNSCWLPSDHITSLAPILQRNGYETVLSGKMHFDKTRRYGFTELFPGWENEHIKTGLVPRRAPDDTSINYKDWETRSAGFRVGSYNPHIMGHDEKVTSYASDYIKKRTDAEKPFFMIAGYLAPHFPLIVPQKYYELYKGKLDLPDIPKGSLERQPRNYQQLRRGFGTVNTDPKVVLKGRELYYGLVSWVDQQIGQLLKNLEESDTGKNTVIIFTSDHGENMGEHGMWWKNCMYDSASKVPLITNWPKRWKGGQRRSKICSLLDVTRTIIDLTGGEAPSDWNGDSMVSWMDNPELPWKDFAVSEYYGKYTASGYVMYRSGQYKYVYHSKPLYPYPRERQFFDMENDPNEFVNLETVPDYQKKIRQMHTAMVAEIGEDPDITENRCFRDISKPYKR